MDGWCVIIAELVCDESRNMRSLKVLPGAVQLNTKQLVVAWCVTNLWAYVNIVSEENRRNTKMKNINL